MLHNMDKFITKTCMLTFLKKPPRVRLQTAEWVKIQGDKINLI